MARKFGTGATNRVGTGKIDDEAPAAEKWAGSVAAQVATAASVKSVLTKTIPVDYIICDPDNPRKLALTIEQIKSIAKQFPLEKGQQIVDEATDWIEDYVQTVAEAVGLSGKSIGDLASLVNFAAALKSADRLLHPIVVRRDENTFHLIAGERRLLAHILLGESNIAARIVEQSYSRLEIATLQWQENVHREDMTLSERIGHVKTLLEAGEGVEQTSVTRLSKIIGRSRSESQRYLAILRCPSKLLLEAIDAGKINELHAAAALAQLTQQQLEDRFSGQSNTSKVKPAISFSNKALAPQFALLIKAAAKQLKMDSIIKDIDMKNPLGINEAIAILVKELEERSRG